MTSNVLDKWPGWRDKVILEWRLRDVPGPAIGEMLAEVEAHLSETGESPQAAFGEPRTYARQRMAELPGLANRGRPTSLSSRAPLWLTWGLDRIPGKELVIAVACGLGGLLAGTAAFSWGRGDNAVLGLPAWVALALGLAIVAGPLLLADDRIIDPRSGKEFRIGGVPGKGVFALVWLVPLLLSLSLGWFSQR